MTIRVSDMNKAIINAGFCFSGEDWTSPYPMREVLVQDVVRVIADYLKSKQYAVVEDYWDESEWTRNYKTEQEMNREYTSSIQANS